MKTTAVTKVSKDDWLTSYDLHLLAEGTHYRSYDRLGAHLVERDGVQGVQFSVWAPNAKRVSVVGDFNDWDERCHSLHCQTEVGIWTGFVAGVTQGSNYKFSIYPNHGGYCLMKSDPCGFYFEVPPRSASVVWDIEGYSWGDAEWMGSRGARHEHDQPLSVYEVHLGSWRRNPEEGNRYLSYREVAPLLAAYVKEMGFTHVQFLPLTEHPFDGSWGYQTLGYFAPTSRFGTPQDFMFLVDTLHQAGIGVLMDWVPAHFPVDGHGLGLFDGTHLYEHADQRQGFHPDWGTFIFNYGRREVANFLLASALFWLEHYHIDGLRVDAVASMLYLDYSRAEGEWVPNQYGGRENLDAIYFLKRLNELVYSRHPDVMMIAEESTSWPMVSRPTYVGGLGFGYKWNMGWMNDTLRYISKDPVHRSYHHQDLTFGLLYAFHENFMLPFSHDEVVHGKGSLLSKMPGDDWQRFANLRALLGLMYGHPGKKLLFMGCEFGQWDEWRHNQSLDWHLLQFGPHQGIKLFVKDLNRVLHEEGALHELDFDSSGFSWIDCNDSSQSTLSFVRYGNQRERAVLCLFNFTPVPRYHYRCGVPFDGFWEELVNSDSSLYGGSGIGNSGGVLAEPIGSHGYPYSVNVVIPPLSALIFRRV